VAVGVAVGLAVGVPVAGPVPPPPSFEEQGQCASSPTSSEHPYGQGFPGPG
jgi:hypothetical protein